MMNKYRILIPVLLVVLMGASVYSLISGAASQQQSMGEMLTQAQQCQEQGLYEKAANYYSEAIKIDERLEYYLAVIDMYFDAEEFEYCEKWCETAIDKFPREIQPYERMVKVCLSDKRYSEAYKTLEDFVGRGLASEEMNEYIKQMDFLYYTDYVSHDEVRYSNSQYVAVGDGTLWGIATVEGANSVLPSLEYVGYFANDMVAVCGEDEVWYFMNATGEYLYNISDGITGNISEVGIYNEGVFPVCVDGKYSYYDLEMQKKLGDYDYASAFYNGQAAVKQGDVWQIIDGTGNSINGENYDDIILDERGLFGQNNRIFVKKQDEYILIDSEGKQVGTEYFEEARNFGSDEYTAVKKDGLWGFINLSGEIIIEPNYQDAKAFSMNLAAVCDDGKWGYVDIEGNLAFDMVYTECLSFSSSGTAYVKTESGWELIKLYKYNY